jgi:acetyl-CoA carboxylase biotin carboxyl carrier protein
VELDFNELRDLLTALNQTDISELTLKSNDFELTVRKELRGGDRIVTTVTAPEGISAPAIAPTPAVAPPPPSPSTPSAAPPGADRLVDITSLMVGTFYRSPSPDEAPFVEVGDRIRVGQTVCIVEAMKVMNEIDTEVAGEIVEILVDNGHPVEYGQPLMRVKPV